MRKVLGGGVVLVWLILAPALAGAQTEFSVFVGGAVTAPVKEVGVAFTRASGNRVVYVSDTTGALQKRLAAGEKADLIVVAGPGMDMLQRDNLVLAGSRVELARALIGVGVKAGAPSPDSVDARDVQGGAPEGTVGVLREPGVGRNVRHLLRGPAAAHGDRRGDETEDRVPHPGVGGG